MTRAMIIGCGRFWISGSKKSELLLRCIKKTNIKLESIYDIDFNKSKKFLKNLI